MFCGHAYHEANENHADGTFLWVFLQEDSYSPINNPETLSILPYRAIQQ